MARLLLVVIFLSLSLSVVAQSTERFEIFGGYSYFDGSYTAEGIFPNNPNGWNVSATGRLNRWVGITADFSGYSQSDGAGDTPVLTIFYSGPLRRSPFTVSRHSCTSCLAVVTSPLLAFDS
jgi:hypothetical protein